MDEELIAPCGMDCSVCSGYLAFKHDVKNKGIRMAYCKGCRPRDKQCAFLKKRCELLSNGSIKYCYECKDFPCKNLDHIDKRYQKNYRMSLIENLKVIKEEGITKLLAKQTEAWKCPKCGGVICCHNGICFVCESEKLKNKKQLYHWDDF